MRWLYAFYENKRVGVLTKDEDDVHSFHYDEAWLNDPEAFPLSLSMPLTQKSFGNRITLSFFENLLPEGQVKKELEGAHRITGVFDFLANFGQDCAGAIVLSESPEVKSTPAEPDLVPVKMETINRAIAEKQSVAEVISEQNPGYLSLAGAQDKFPATVVDGKVYLPRNGYPTTHIVKVPIWRHGVKESVYNEYFCMRLARQVGLEVPDCWILPGKHPLFVVERFDRSKNGERVRRVHQQDLCQAQGYPSEQKYESAGGPSIKQNYEFLVQHCSPKQRVSSLSGFLDWICFNLIIGNNDCHSKNASLLAEGNRYRLAPFYDLMSTAIYPRLARHFPFKIGSQTEFSKIGGQQITDLETQLGLKPGVFGRKLREMARMIQETDKELAGEIRVRFPEAKIPRRIAQELIEKRIKGLHLHQAIP